MKGGHRLSCRTGFTVTVTTGRQTEGGAGEPAEAAVGAGEAGGREEADGGLPAEGRAGVGVRSPPTPAPARPRQAISRRLSLALGRLMPERIQPVVSHCLTSTKLFTSH